MEIKCNHCGFLWNYRGVKRASGRFRVFITCPTCLGKVSLNDRIVTTLILRGTRF